MKLGRPQAVLVLTQEQRAQLESLASSRSLPHGLVIRVRIILLSAQGLTNRSIAVRLRWTEATVGKWRRRFLVHGISGWHDEWRPGRPRSISDERVARLLRRTLQTKPRDGTHWSVRQLAAQSRLAKLTVHRIWQALGVQPHRQRSFHLSNDPFFVEKVRDIVGLYLNPPDKAVVLGVDETGLGADAALAAAGVGLRRRSHARLPPTGDNHTVRRAEHGERHRAQPVPTPPSASGISGLPAADRQQRAGWGWTCT